MTKFTERQQKELARLADLAYECEVDDSLRELDKEFLRWRAGEIAGSALANTIHRFDRERNRELFRLYDGLDPDVLVARALVMGVLHRDEVAAELLHLLEHHMAFYERQALDEE